MTTRHEYIEKFKNKLDECDADIDVLEVKARETTDELKVELVDQLASLRVRRDIAKLKLAEIKDASEEAWEDIKGGADEAWSSLKQAIEKARSHF